MEVPVSVWRVGRDEESRYLLILRDDLDHPLMMQIGACEAVSIWAALRGERLHGAVPKPMAHDLLCDLIRSLGGRLLKVVVDDFWNDVYFAKLHIAVDSTVVTVDSRPSDAIALALRFGAPLFVQDTILAAESAEQPGDRPGQWEEEPEGS